MEVLNATATGHSLGLSQCYAQMTSCVLQHLQSSNLAATLRALHQMVISSQLTWLYVLAKPSSIRKSLSPRIIATLASCIVDSPLQPVVFLQVSSARQMVLLL